MKIYIAGTPSYEFKSEFKGLVDEKTMDAMTDRIEEALIELQEEHKQELRWLEDDIKELSDSFDDVSKKVTEAIYILERI